MADSIEALASTISGNGPGMLLLHGFTGSAAEWAQLTPQLTPLRRVLAVDLIGHGRSPAPIDLARYSLERCTDDLRNLVDHHGLAQIDLLGYSMGGRVALQFAATHPARVRRMVLISASPGLADPAERAARVASDEALADQLEAQGLDWFVDYWATIPLFASQAATLTAEDRVALRERRRQGSARGYANSLRGMGAGRMTSRWADLPNLDLPTLVISGEYDAKYVELGRQTAALLPNARHVVVQGAGHAVHLEQPQALANLVVRFMME